ncbi:MAG: GNAT family N-acetyltransferase [Candidatus Magasanikbacteria bacterium]|nr:GNAT family N-acetyltransferase [Candidatus Magasanikbacteria bacterium]
MIKVRLMIKYNYKNMETGKKTTNQDSYKLVPVDSKKNKEVITEKGVDNNVEKESKDFEEKIRNFAFDFFDSSFSHVIKSNEMGKTLDGIYLLEDTEKKLAILSGDEENYENRIIGKQFQKAVEIFLEEMVKFIKEKKKENNLKDVERFTDYIEESLFYSSPSLLSNLDLSSQFDLAAATTRVPELQGFVGPGMVGDMVYELSFYPDNSIVDEFYNKIITSPVAKQLDYLDFIKIMAQKASAQGSWARPALNRMIELSNKLSKDTKLPFVKYASDSTLELLNVEKQEPSHDVVQMRGGRKYGRQTKLNEYILQKHEKFSHIIMTDIDLADSDRLLRVSQDYVGVMDQAGSINYFSKFEKKEEEIQKSDYDILMVRTIKEFVQHRGDVMNQQDLNRLIGYINRNLLDIKQPKQIIKFWQEQEVLTDEEWVIFFESDSRITDLHREFEKFKKDIYKESGFLAEKASRDYVQSFIQKISSEKNNYLQKRREQVLKALREGDEEEAFSIASNTASAAFALSSGLEKGSTNRVVEDLRMIYEDITKRHDNIWHEANLKLLEEQKKIEAKNSKLFENFSSLFGKIFENKEELNNNLYTTLKKIEKQTENHLRKVHMISGDRLMEDPAILPFGVEDAKEEELLLFQQLHRPGLKSYIEDKLNFNFEELDLRTQLHFLSFVSEKDDGTFEDVEDLMQNKHLDHQAFLKTFFACAADRKIGQDIINFARTNGIEKANPIFERYQELIEDISEVEKLIADFFVSKKGKQVDTRKVVQEIVLRSNRTLIQGMKLGEKVNVEELNYQLQKIRKDVSNFASIFKTAFKGKEKIDLESIKGLDFSTSKIEELTDEDKQEMQEIAKKNWLPRGKAGEGVIKEFGETLESGKDIDFYVLKQDENLVSFMRFDKPDSDGHRYAGSFNVDPEYRGSAIGEAMLVNALEEQAKNYVIDATVHPGIQVGTDYVEKRGFNITGVIPNYDDSGETFFAIELDRYGNEKLNTKDKQDYSQEKFVSIYNSIYKDKKLEELIGSKIIVRHFDPKKQGDLVEKEVGELTENGYIGTRYFTDPEDDTQRYYVFEIDRRKKKEMRDAA